MPETCVFCRIIAGTIPAQKIYQDAHVVGIRDLNPQAPLHVLLLPRKHLATLNELSPDDAELAGRLVLAARAVANDEGYAQSGYRTVFNCNADAGQSVWHIHLHLLAGRTLAWPPG